jgi:hypothetical protein
MNQTLIAGLKATARDFHTAGQALTSAAGRLEALAAALEKEITAQVPGADGPPSYKKPDGRLSEAGTAAVDAALTAGMSITAIAKDLQVHPSAISKRRKAWLKSQNKSA